MPRARHLLLLLLLLLLLRAPTAAGEEEEEEAAAAAEVAATVPPAPAPAPRARARAPPPPKPKPKPKPPPPPPPPAPAATMTNNRLQYHKHLGPQALSSGEYEHCIEIGFHIPTGLKAGDTLVISGRTLERAGDQEAADFLNRARGHKVLFAEDYKHNADGNGGRVWIEGHPTSAVHSNTGGGKNEHTFDGAMATKK